MKYGGGGSHVRTLLRRVIGKITGNFAASRPFGQRKRQFVRFCVMDGTVKKIYQGNFREAGWTGQVLTSGLPTNRPECDG
jgi:hypothetical protein